LPTSKYLVNKFGTGTAKSLKKKKRDITKNSGDNWGTACSPQKVGKESSKKIGNDSVNGTFSNEKKRRQWWGKPPVSANRTTRQTFAKEKETPSSHPKGKKISAQSQPQKALWSRRGEKVGQTTR